MKVLILLTSSPESYLLKNKLSSPNHNEKNNKKYYFIQNKRLNEWLKWKQPKIKKILLALEIGFEDFILWNSKTWIIYWISYDLLYYACKVGSRNLIDMIMNLYKKASHSQKPYENILGKAINTGFAGACVGGHMEIVKQMIDEGATEKRLFFACKGGNMDIVKLIIERGGKDWNHGLRCACVSRNMELVELMITNSATDWVHGLISACIGGNKDIIQLMISKGANCWHVGLTGACRSGSKEIVELLIARGGGATHFENNELVELMISKGAEPLDE